MRPGKLAPVLTQIWRLALRFELHRRRVRMRSVHQLHRSDFTPGAGWRDNGSMPSRKPKSKPTAWRVHYLGGKKRRELGIVYAVDQAAAEAEAAWVFNIPEAGRKRIVVEPM